MLAESILLVGDTDHQVETALAGVASGASITPVVGYFEAISELTNARYTTIIAAAEPIERRPESAVRVLRELAPDARFLLFGHPTLEPLARKMLDFGADDYLIAPAAPAELSHLLRQSHVRLAPPPAESGAPSLSKGVARALPGRMSMLLGLPIADIFLDAMLTHPQNAVADAVRRINLLLDPPMQLVMSPAAGPAHTSPGGEGVVQLTATLIADEKESGSLQLNLPRDEDESAGRHFLTQVCQLVGKAQSLQRRQQALQKLAITDELTGLYNGRYFRHFLTQILEKARSMRFSVTLLLFDIDNFKKYNDLYGHGVGDEILRQTASLMRRCCRDHDLVARISGDEFAVVFWEKEGPRQPRDVRPGQIVSRVPQTPLVIAERFRRMMSSDQFTALGPTGKGKLTISGGMAVYPWNAQTVDTLIEAADKALMFGAKQEGKDSIRLVGSEEE